MESAGAAAQEREFAKKKTDSAIRTACVQERAGDDSPAYKEKAHRHEEIPMPERKRKSVFFHESRKNTLERLKRKENGAKAYGGDWEGSARKSGRKMRAKSKDGKSISRP